MLGIYSFSKLLLKSFASGSLGRTTMPIHGMLETHKSRATTAPRLLIQRTTKFESNRNAGSLQISSAHLRRADSWSSFCFFSRASFSSRENDGAWVNDGASTMGRGGEGDKKQIKMATDDAKPWVNGGGSRKGRGGEVNTKIDPNGDV